MLLVQMRYAFTLAPASIAPVKAAHPQSDRNLNDVVSGAYRGASLACVWQTTAGMYDLPSSFISKACCRFSLLGSDLEHHHTRSDSRLEFPAATEYQFSRRPRPLQMHCEFWFSKA
jgi:hypothetical protein